MVTSAIPTLSQTLSEPGERQMCSSTSDRFSSQTYQLAQIKDRKLKTDSLFEVDNTTMQNPMFRGALLYLVIK